MSPCKQAVWDRRFLQLAEQVSTWSKDPSTRCGSVVTNGRNNIVSLGFNGFPPGIEDKPEWLEDRSIKLKIVRHAEANALYHASFSRLPAKAIYVWPMPPCAQCASAIIQAGLQRIVTCRPDPSRAERWSDDWGLAEEMYLQAGIYLDYLALPEG